jgi:repressor LexA
VADIDSKHLAKLRTHWKRHAAFPSMAKLCETLGLASTSSVFALIGRLVDAGYLERVEGRIAPTRKFFARPVLSSVRAGLPQPASQEEPDLLTLDDYLIDDPNRTSLHKVRGDSMKDLGILEGDLVVVEHNTPTKPGDIVVAYADNELTVKTLQLDAQRRYFLQPANSAYKPIFPSTSLEVLGVVIGVVRKTRT